MSKLGDRIKNKKAVQAEAKTRNEGDPKNLPTGMNKEEFIKRVRTRKEGVPSADALKNQMDFLDHPFYKQNATNVWGENMFTNIQAQKDRMKNATIKEGLPARGSDGSRAIASYSPPMLAPGTKYPANSNKPGQPVQKSLTQGLVTYNNKVNTYKPDALGNATHDVEHELGHASDLVSKMDVIKGSNPMAPEYSGYQNVDLKPNPSFMGQDFADYLTKPSEFRTRLNHVKKLMTKDGFNWNTASGKQINNYIEDKLRLKDPTVTTPDNSVHGLKAGSWNELRQFRSYNQNKKGKQEDGFLEHVFKELAGNTFKQDKPNILKNSNNFIT